jgi:hypothetical protein
MLHCHGIKGLIGKRNVLRIHHAGLNVSEAVIERAMREIVHHLWGNVCRGDTTLHANKRGRG